MTMPTLWFASAIRPAHDITRYDRIATNATSLVEMLRLAESILIERAGITDVNRSRAGLWAGPQLRIYVEESALLLADARHGTEIQRLAQRLTREGLAHGIRLELAW